jgi:hypothetical protein
VPIPREPTVRVTTWQDIGLQTIYFNPAPWDGGGTLWTVTSNTTHLLVGNSWTTQSISCYYENGVLTFDVRNTGAGDAVFRIGMRANRHGRPVSLYWNDLLPAEAFATTDEWQTVTLYIRDLIDGHNNPDFDLNDMWFIGLQAANAPGVSASPRLEFRDIRLSSPDDERQPPFVRVNQVGYEVGRPKPAVVGHFYKFGTLDNREFQVINAANGTVAYTGNMGVGVLDPFSDRSWSGEMLYHIYFCGLDTPGEYLIRIPDSGFNPDARSPRDIEVGLEINNIESARFTIANNVYEGLLVDVVRYYYFQRQGLDLEERYAGDFARANLHPNDAAVRRWSDRNNTNVEPHDIYDVSQGWYDAGDYGKYIAPSAATMSDLLWAYELFPQSFAGLDLNIPEQNPNNPLYVNAPGVLSEMKWQLDKMMKFEHHSRDGSFFIAANYCSERNIIWIEDTLNRSTNHNSPEEQRDLRSHHATAGMAAVLAHGYIVYRNYPVFADFAEEMLAAALRAWNWVTDPNNPQHRRIDAANRAYTFGDEDLARTMYWAAGALYRAVSIAGGNTAPYLAYMLEHIDCTHVNRPFTGWNSVCYSHGGISFKGFAHYLLNNPAPTSAIRDRFMNGYSEWRRIMNTYMINDWRITYPAWGLWWGSNQMIVANSLTMVLGGIVEAQINGTSGVNARTVEHMEASLHYMMGMNPLSFSYVSGHGENSVMNIFSAIFSRDARLEPYRIPPGYFTEGPNIYDNRHLSQFDGKAYVDSDGEWTTNENTIYHNAALTFLIAAIIGHTV